MQLPIVCIVIVLLNRLNRFKEIKVYIGMNRYENGKIYKVVDVGFNKCYIGSTCEMLSKRMERHRNSYRKYLRTDEMETRCHLLFDEFGVENCKIMLIENYPCNSKEELFRKEGEYIQNLDCINRYVAGRTRQAHFKEHAEEIRERNRQHKKIVYEQNPQIYKDRVKAYQEKNKDVVIPQRKKRYEAKREEILKRQKDNREANKEIFNQRRREYYQQNREKMRAKITCSCGATICKKGLSRHKKSEKHQDWLKEQEPEQEPQLQQLD